MLFGGKFAASVSGLIVSVVRIYLGKGIQGICSVGRPNSFGIFGSVQKRRDT